MATVPRSLVTPLSASFWIGARVVFCCSRASKPPPWIMKSGMTRWNRVPSKKPDFTYSRKFATVFGALSAYSSRTIRPWLVSRATLGFSMVPPISLGCLFLFRGGGARAHHARLADHDGIDGNVLVEPLRGRRHGDDGVDHLHALDDLAEHGVAPALRGLALEVEGRVVGHVDEELGRGAVRVRGAGHGEGAAVVGDAVVRLVLDRRPGGLLLHVGSEAAALDHEAGDHPVKDRAVVLAGFHVVEEVLDGLRSLAGVELDHDLALGRIQLHPRVRGSRALHLGSRARGLFRRRALGLGGWGSGRGGDRQKADERR